MGKFNAMMLSVTFALIACLTFAFAGLAFAADEMPLQDWIGQALAMKGLSGFALAAAVVKLLVDATKTKLLGGLFQKLPDGAQLLLVTGLSAISAGLMVKVNGGSWMDVLLATVQSAGGAMLLNELLKRLFGIGAGGSVSALKKR